MNIDDRPTTDLRAHSHILGKFHMAITLQRVNRSPSCLVLGWGFRDGGSNGAISDRVKFKMAAGGHLGKLQMAISATHYPIHCMYVHRPYFAVGL